MNVGPATIRGGEWKGEDPLALFQELSNAFESIYGKFRRTTSVET